MAPIDSLLAELCPESDESPTSGRHLRGRELAALEQASARTLRAFERLPRALLGSAPLIAAIDAPSLARLVREDDPDLRAESFGQVALLLASRGVPSIVLEKHLVHAAKEIRGLSAEHERLARRLFEESGELSYLREELLPASELRRLVEETSSELGGELAVLELLAISVLDELGGADHACSRTLDALMLSVPHIEHTPKAYTELLRRTHHLAERHDGVNREHAEADRLGA